MKTRTIIRRLLVAAVVFAATARPAFAQGARLQLDGLARFAARAADVTDIALDESMLQFAGGFLSGQDSASVKPLLTGLKGIYVKSFQFSQDNVVGQADLQVIRNQLTGNPSWVRLVSTQSTANRESVDIYVWREREIPGGLAILVSEPRELTVVNIVGIIDLAKLAALGGQFGIPKLPLPPTPPTPPTPPAR